MYARLGGGPPCRKDTWFLIPRNEHCAIDLYGCRKHAPLIAVIEERVRRPMRPLTPASKAGEALIARLLRSRPREPSVTAARCVGVNGPPLFFGDGRGHQLLWDLSQPSVRIMRRLRLGSRFVKSQCPHSEQVHGPPLEG